MTKRITVEVTEEDILNGKKHQVDSCPIALALSRTTGEKWLSGANFGSPESPKSWIHVTYPQKVKDFIYYFDLGLVVEPFSFEIEIPEENNGE